MNAAKSKSRLRKIGALFLGIAVSVLMLELGSWVCLKIWSPPVRGASQNADQAEEICRTAVLRHPQWGHVLDPQRTTCGGTVNRHGFLAEDWRRYEVVKYQDTRFDIALLGGSVAHHLGTVMEPNGLEDEIRSLFEARSIKQPVRVWNLAIPGWRLPQQLSLLISERRHFDAVIHVFGFNESVHLGSGMRPDYNPDFIWAGQAQWLDSLSPTQILTIGLNQALIELQRDSLLANRSYSVRLLQHLADQQALRAIRPELHGSWQDTLGVDPLARSYQLFDDLGPLLSQDQGRSLGLEMIKDNLLLMDQTAKQSGLYIVHFLQPTIYDKPHLTSSERELTTQLRPTNYHWMREQILSQGLGAQLQLVDLRDIFRSERRQLYVDDVHLHVQTGRRGLASVGYSVLNQTIAREFIQRWVAGPIRSAAAPRSQ